jgi:hypothetical protein
MIRGFAMRCTDARTISKMMLLNETTWHEKLMGIEFCFPHFLHCTAVNSSTHITDTV